MAAGIFLDLQNEAIVSAGNTYGTAISSTAGLTGVDEVDNVGNRIAAMLTSSAVAGSGNVTIKMQESVDDVDGDYTDIIDPRTGVAYTFAALTAANTLQIISFNTNKRWVRGYATLNSGTSVTAQLTIISDRKETPANTGGFDNSSTGPS